MGAVATMIVRIGADVTDLTKGMDKATKEVAKASERIAALGKSMTLYVTAPVAAAGYELFKFAAEADSLGDRLERVFGEQTGAMTDFIKDLRQTVPESTMALDKMAISIQNLALNMGMNRQQATQMSEGMLRMAADASAFTDGSTSMAEALDALEKGLAGKGRGLIQFGIIMKNTEIAQEAWRMGLMKSGKQLTPLGTALAAWSLMQKGATRIMGESGRIADEEGTKFRMLKANLVDAAVHIGSVLMPAFNGILDVLNKMATLLGKVNPKIIEFVAVGATIAALVGPILGLIAGLGKLIVLIRGIGAAITAIRTAGGIASMLTALAAPEVIAAIGLLAVAITGIVMAWKAFHKEAEKPVKISKAISSGLGTSGVGDGATSIDPDKIKSAFETLESNSKAISAEFEYAKSRGEDISKFYEQATLAQARLTQFAKNGADDVKTKAIAAMRSLQPLLDEKKFASLGLGQKTGQVLGLPATEFADRLSKKADELSGAFENAVTQGGDVTGIFQQSFQYATMLEDAIDALPDKTSAWAIALGQAYEKLRPLMMAGEMMGFSGETHRGDSAGHGFNAPAAAAKQYGTDLRDYQNTVKLRLEMLKLPPIFDKLGEAMIQEKERHRKVSQELDLAKMQFRSLRVVIMGFEDAITAGMAEILNMISSASIGQRIMDKVEGAVSNFLDSTIDKTFGYVTNAIGSLFGRGKHKTGKGTPLDALLQGINFEGTAAASKAALRAMEAQIKTQLKGNLSLEQRIAAESKLTQIQQALGEASQALNESLSNAPSGFRIALARFNATGPGAITLAPNQTPVNTGSGDTHIYGPITIQAGSKSLKELFAELALMQKRNNKRGGASPLQVALSGA